MPEPTHAANDPENEALIQRLKSTLHLPLGTLIDHTTLSLSTPHRAVNATPQFIASLTQLTYAQIETVAQDLEAFAKHRSNNPKTSRGGEGRGKKGGRRIEVKDVLLLGRRNEALRGLLEEEVGRIDNLLHREGKGKGGVAADARNRGDGREGRGGEKVSRRQGQGQGRTDAGTVVNGKEKKTKTAQTTATTAGGKRNGRGKEVGRGRRRGGFIDDEADDDDENDEVEGDDDDDDEDEGSQAEEKEEEEADRMEVDEDDEE